MSETPQEFTEPERQDPEREIPRPAPEVISDGDLEPGPEPDDDAKALAAEHAHEFDDIEGETGDVH
jgi:hypothetical protein